MADHDHKATWDGRFGERFDDEVSTKNVLYTIVGTGFLTVLGIVAMYVMFHALVPSADEVPAADAQLAPPLPRLQADPESELVAFRAQLEARLAGYGWVDEAAGIAHMPIEDAIVLLAERGLPSRIPDPHAETAAEEGGDMGAGKTGVEETEP